MTKKNEQIFSAEYDRKSPARVTISHLKSKIFTTDIIFETIPDDDSFLSLNKDIDAQLSNNENARSDLYFEFAKSRISDAKGYLIPEGKTWRDVVPESDIVNAFTKLVMVKVEPRAEVAGDHDLYNPLATVAMDVKFFDNSGVEVTKEISFNPVTRAQLKEFKYAKQDKPNPDALASHAKKNMLDRLCDLTKDVFHSANYTDVPNWHIMQAGLTYLEIEEAQAGKF